MIDDTGLRCSVAEDWPLSNGSVTRRVGWLDQRGRVTPSIPDPDNRQGDEGSWTPLLIEIGKDD